MTDQELIQRAKLLYHEEGEVEVDDNTVVSRGRDGGAYVQAWVWVDDGDERGRNGTGTEAERKERLNQ